MQIGDAHERDAAAISEVLEELVRRGLRTGRADSAHVLSHYLLHPQRLSCVVARGPSAEIVGFQSLKIADAANPYGTPLGWGIIGTHVRPSAARSGIGSRLFAATLDAARKSGLPAIEAYIAQTNRAALGYYDSMGFRTFRRAPGIICKAYYLSS